MMKLFFPNSPEITFPIWMGVGVPFVLVFLTLLFLYISVKYINPSSKNSNEEINEAHIAHFQRQLDDMGTLSWPEKVILADFSVLVFLWMFRADIVISGDKCVAWKGCLPGWSNLLPQPDYVRDSTIAIFGALVLFFVPVGDEKHSKVLDWETCKKLSWGLLWLLGGGFALAKAIEETGLAEWLGSILKRGEIFPPEIILVIVVALMVFLTEVIANTPAAQICVPIVIGIAVEIKINPMYLAVPATLAASCAFMLPTATGPNSVVFGYGILKLTDMLSTGMVLNCFSVLALPLCWFAFGQWVYNANPRTYPDWAVINATAKI